MKNRLFNSLKKRLSKKTPDTVDIIEDAIRGASVRLDLSNLGLTFLPEFALATIHYPQG